MGVGSNSEAGVMFVKELSMHQKAAPQTLIALSAGLKGQELKDYIEGIRHET